MQYKNLNLQNWEQLEKTCKIDVSWKGYLETIWSSLLLEMEPWLTLQHCNLSQLFCVPSIKYIFPNFQSEPLQTQLVAISYLILILSAEKSLSSYTL